MTVRADAGRIDQALQGYRDLIDYWERTGSWIQQWTTLRNLARLWHTLGDHEPARFLEIAADQAPDAPAANDTAPTQPWPPDAHHPGTADQVAPTRVQAPPLTRAHVLEVARRSINVRLGQ